MEKLSKKQEKIVKDLMKRSGLSKEHVISRIHDWN